MRKNNFFSNQKYLFMKLTDNGEKGSYYLIK